MSNCCNDYRHESLGSKKFEGIDSMDVKLVRIGIGEAEKLWKMQIKVFQSLYEEYDGDDGQNMHQTI